MSTEPRSITEHIECLARLTGAPESFIGQVKALFSKKGISLEADAAPYLKALEEAFKREEAIRASAQRVRQNLTRLQENFSRIGRSYVQQLEQLRRLEHGVPGAKRRTDEDGEVSRVSTRPISIGGNHRSIVTRQQHDHQPLVPGPEDEQ